MHVNKKYGDILLFFIRSTFISVKRNSDYFHCLAHLLTLLSKSIVLFSLIGLYASVMERNVNNIIFLSSLESRR